MEWLVLEFGTVAQQLKNNTDQRIPQIKTVVRNDLQKYEPFKRLKMDGEILVNFLTKKVLDEISKLNTNQNLERATSHIVGHYMQDLGDFIFATWQHTKSKLNSPSYTTQQIKTDSERWHEDIAAKKAELPSDEYSTFIELKGPWSGWKWVSLGRGYCPQEAKAMGHCGNSGARDGDDILSLRDPEGNAHLTFINNDGVLGEMKGRGNSKPSKRYHPAIIELLKHPDIHVVKGGGYDPKNNFSVKDLPEAEQNAISSLKPNIDNIVKYKFQKGDVSGIAWDLGLNEKDIKIEGDTVTLAKYDIGDLERIVSGNSLEYWFGDGSERYDNGPGQNISWRDIDHYADDELEDLMVKVAKQDEEKADDAEEAWEASNTVMSSIVDAFNDAYLSGAESEAWDSLKKTLESSDKYGFWVDTSEHPYRLQIHSKDLSDFVKSASSDGGSIDLEDHLLEKRSFSFEEPRSGFSGFDREMFLQNAKDSLKSHLGAK